jgi:hypothetical protein
MIELREHLDDLVAGVPGHIVRDDLAARAWTRGRRRRWGRRAAVLAAMLGVLLLSVPVFVGNAVLVPAGILDGDNVKSVTGYPQRIEHQWWTPGLPQRPGPLAALLNRDSDTLTWYAVSPHGDQWRLPQSLPFDIYPALSPDGRYLGFYEDPAHRMVDNAAHGHYFLRDLATGHDTVFNGPQVDDQSPAFWAPDGRRMASMAMPEPDDTDGKAVILGVDGTAKRIPAHGALAGWLDDDHLVWLAQFQVFHNAPGGLVIVVTDLDGTTRSIVGLGYPANGQPLSQHSAIVSHGRLLYRADSGRTQQTFRLDDGARVGRLVPDDTVATCPLTIADSGPLVTDRPQSVAALRSDAGPVIVVDPAAHVYCIFLVSGALAGEPHGGVFGLAQTPWTWWWREILAGLILAAVLVVLLLMIRRRNLRPGIPRDPSPGPDHGHHPKAAPPEGP